jgi:peptidoglycan/xylan/chitin deacetylase (PgdA/CDA1 family)
MELNWFEQKTLGLFVKTKGKLSLPMFSGMGHIFMLHRILPSSEREQYMFNKGLAITPQTLQKHIRFFKAQGYRFISMDQLAQELESSSSPPNKFICITLDDGYLDNFTFGLPIFEEEEVPFTLYVTNCFPNQTALTWWFTLEEIIQKNECVYFGNEKYNTTSQTEKTSVFHLLRRKILDLPQMELHRILPELVSVPIDEWRKPINSLSASWDSLKKYASHPLVNIGAHTINHVSRAGLSDDEVRHEMTRSRQEIEEKTGVKVKHFAYPYGGLQEVSIRNMQLAMESGFQTAVLNHPGNVYHAHEKSRMALPRYPLGEETTIEELNYITNGIRHFSVNGWRKCIRYL